MQHEEGAGNRASGKGMGRRRQPGTSMESQGYIEVDLFSKDVDSLDHPEVIAFKGLLEDVAEDFRCRLTSFEIQEGTAVFSFDSEELMAEILNLLQAL